MLCTICKYIYIYIYTCVYCLQTQAEHCLHLPSPPLPPYLLTPLSLRAFKIQVGEFFTVPSPSPTPQSPPVFPRSSRVFRGKKCVYSWAMLLWALCSSSALVLIYRYALLSFSFPSSRFLRRHRSHLTRPSLWPKNELDPTRRRSKNRLLEKQIDSGNGRRRPGAAGKERAGCGERTNEPGHTIRIVLALCNARITGLYVVENPLSLHSPSGFLLGFRKEKMTHQSGTALVGRIDQIGWKCIAMQPCWCDWLWPNLIPFYSYNILASSILSFINPFGIYFKNCKLC